MKQYLANLKAWAIGFVRTDQIRFKPGWSADWRWFCLYLLDYGTHVLTGGAVVSWSRWAYDHRESSRVAALLNRLLNRLDARHGEEAGPALWGTTDCPIGVRLTACAVWAVVLGLGYGK